MRRATPLALAGVVLAVAVALVSAIGDAAGPRASPAGSTLDSTYADADGNGILVPAPGEPLTDRTELARPSPERRTLALFAQISDAHVRDEESPARAPLLDRLSPRLDSTFRPQEALSAQTLAAAVAAVDTLGPQAVLVTGDLIDSAQANELDQALAVLRGGRVDPDSGAPGYQGPQQLSNPDPFIYRPDLDSPRHPGLLELAERPFDSPGLDSPWYPLAGNHDLLVQGEVPSSGRLERLATGDRELTRLDPDLHAPRAARLTPRLAERYLASGLPGKTRRVVADPRRRHLSPSQVIARLRAASGDGGGGRRLEYSFDVGARLRVIALDLVRRRGGSAGRVTATQLAWLRRELDRAGRDWVIVASHQPLESSAGGEAALAELDRDPRVLAAVAGHAHTNSIEPRRSPAGGYWLIETASLADYPQQARAFRLVETVRGVALETWMLDTAPAELADTARDLAFLDAGGGRPQGDAGEPEDRNARLYR